jgi:parvulin-like peptidyl-prolyl isomerase
MLDNDFTAEPAGEVTKQFGEKFTSQFGEISPGKWQGPVETGFGMHVVFLAERTQGRVPPFEDVRDAVRREWESARRLEAKERFYQELLKRYAVTIEQPAVKAAQKTAETK